MRTYANAKDVLPPDLLEEVRKHYTGPLYVPRDKSAVEKRDLVINLAQSNTSTAMIAKVTELSRRRVNQILAGKRRQKWEWIE